MKDKNKTVNIAVCQILCIAGDREGNFQRIENALTIAGQQKADIACFPESVLFGWTNPVVHEKAEPIPGLDSDRICALAKKSKMMISIGLDEKDGDHVHDTTILVDRRGTILLKHRKINILEDLMTPPYTRGKPEDIAVVDTEFGRIGTMICADTFIDAYIERMRELAPDLVIVPYGWAGDREQWPEHAKSLHELVCRIAKMWNCPVVGTDTVGVMEAGPWKGRTFGGASIVATRKGEPKAILADRDVEVRVVPVKIHHLR